MQDERSMPIISIEWNNPYTQPPSGLPRVLRSACPLPGPGNEEYLKRFFGNLKSKYPPGYVICWTPPFKPIKMLSGSSLAKMRRSRMENRIRKKAPLFADQLIKAELKKRPEYYCPIECEKRQEERRKKMKELYGDDYMYWLPGWEENKCEMK